MSGLVIAAVLVDVGMEVGAEIFFLCSGDPTGAELGMVRGTPVEYPTEFDLIPLPLS